MLRLLIAAFCSLSLLLCTAATAITVRSHRASNRVVWPAEAGEGVRTSLASIWREYRNRDGANGRHTAGPGGADIQLLTLTSPQGRPKEHRSLSLANGKLEYHRHPVPGPFC